MKPNITICTQPELVPPAQSDHLRKYKNSNKEINVDFLWQPQNCPIQPKDFLIK